MVFKIELYLFCFKKSWMLIKIDLTYTKDKYHSTKLMHVYVNWLACIFLNMEKKKLGFLRYCDVKLYIILYVFIINEMLSFSVYRATI